MFIFKREKVVMVNGEDVPSCKSCLLEASVYNSCYLASLFISVDYLDNYEKFTPYFSINTFQIIVLNSWPSLSCSVHCWKFFVVDLVIICGKISKTVILCKVKLACLKATTLKIVH